MLTATKGRGPGQWWPLLAGDRLSASYYCPQCGEPMSLVGHTIDANGAVSPSIVAPVRDANQIEHPCGFHDFVTLHGWSDAAANAVRGGDALGAPSGTAGGGWAGEG